MVVVASAVAATIGSVVLATRNPGASFTTRGIVATLRVPGHPGPVAAGADVLWVALNGNPARPAGDQPLLRVDLATGTVLQMVDVSGEVSYLARDGGRLLASVTPVGGGEFGPRRLVALDWRSGNVLPLGGSHLRDTDAQNIDGPVDQIVRNGNSLWALEVLPGVLLQLDPGTLTPLPPIRVSSGRTLGLASGDGYLWVTATDTGQILRINPATGAITRANVGGSPVGIAIDGNNVWFADHSDGKVARLDARSLRPVGDPVPVAGKPTWLGVAGNSLFVTDEGAGTVARLDAQSGRRLGPPIRVAAPDNGAVAPVLATSGDSVWVSSFSSSAVTHITFASSVAAGSSDVTLTGTGNGPVKEAENGGVAGTGHFTATGAIKDKGTYIGYRTVKGDIATIRDIMVGHKGTFTIVITIHLGRESPPPWTITAGTKSYLGLHATGRLIVDDYAANPYTFVLTGSVSR